MTIRTYTSDDIGASGRGREGAICREGRGFQVYIVKRDCRLLRIRRRFFYSIL